MSRMYYLNESVIKTNTCNMLRVGTSWPLWLQYGTFYSRSILEFFYLVF